MFTFFQIHPGGVLYTTYLRVEVDVMTVDVLGEVIANGAGYEAQGTFVIELFC